MVRKQTRIATYFKSLVLENVRCFGSEQPLDLTDEEGRLKQWTLIVGDNGVGKTTLLQSLVWARPVLIKKSESDTDEVVEQSEGPLDYYAALNKGTLGAALGEEDNDMLERLLRIGEISEFIITATVCQGPDLTFDSVPNNKEISTEVKALFDEKRLLSDVVQQKKIYISTELNGEFWEPFVVTYGANRQMGLLNITDAALEESLTLRLSKSTELYDVEERLTTLHHAASDKQLKRLERGTAKKDSESREERLLRTFKRALAHTLPDEIKNVVKNEDDIVIEAPKFDEGELKKSTVKIKTFPNLVPFSDLSLGYQTMMAWVLDLAWRLFSRYPKSRTPLEEPAIVIIDEIDLHLHPHWQLEIMGKLANVFKRTQFIATAHSPIMVQSMPNANFAIVQKDEDEVFIVNEPERIKGWRVDQILNSEYFGISSAWDPETEQLFDERNELLHKSKRTSKENARLKKLEKQIAALPTATKSEDRKAMELIRKAAQLLEKKN